LADVAAHLVQAFLTLERCFTTGGTLFIAGNGGSMADALHISGELDKAYMLPRRIPEAHAERLGAELAGKDLAKYLQQGLRTVVLGINLSLRSAIENDIPLPGIELAQELYVLAKPGDVFLGISTSGNARNILYAASLARARGLSVLGMTGERGGNLADLADVLIKAPGVNTAQVQEVHIQAYHMLCEMLEVRFFGNEA
jgi:D-sedoheptulose 7-phosphate isomerase